MIDVGTWEDFLRFVKRSSWAWNSLLGQEDERKLLGFLGTEVASTSGTAIDFTGVPSWVTEIKINFVGVSTNGANNYLIQIGASGGIETSGYSANSAVLSNGATVSCSVFTTGFGLAYTNAINVVSGTVTLTLENAATNTWTASGLTSTTAVSANVNTAGSKALSGVLDRVRITTSGGTDTFDAGVINIRMS